MPMNIISNYAANVALKNLTLNGGDATKSVAKLSSGSRVVTSADDAASMAIGSRLNTEVKSLNQASVNAGQGVSMLQIADGAASRVQDILTRMKVLAVQSGSGNLSDTERAMLDTEYQNLLSEVDRLVEDTRFNGDQLLATSSSRHGATTGGTKGSVYWDVNYAGGAATAKTAQGAGKFGIGRDGSGTNGVVDITFRGIDNRATTMGGDANAQVKMGILKHANKTGYHSTAGVTFVAAVVANGGNTKTTANNAWVKFTATLDPDLIDITGGPGNEVLTTGVTLNFNRFQTSEGTTNQLSEFTRENASLMVSLDQTFSVANIANTGANHAMSANMNTTTVNLGDATPVTNWGLAAVTYGWTMNIRNTLTVSSRASDLVDPAKKYTFKVGTGIDPSEDNIDIAILGLDTETLGISNSSVAKQDLADAASGAISAALDYLVDIRADIGGAMNRMEAASDNIATMMENMEAARSQMLDLDVAAEITNFTNKQILMQAGVSTLAQANQLPQNLLRLFA